MRVLATTLSLAVIDPAASASFLANHFGFREALSFDSGAAVEHPDGGPTVFFLRKELDALDPSRREVLAQGLILALTVEDVDGEAARLQAEGVEPATPTRQDEWGERSMQVADPNGSAIQIVEWVGERPC